MIRLMRMYQSNEGVMTLYNISTLDYTSNNGSFLSSISAVPDGSIIFAGFDNSFDAYTYSHGTATFMKTLVKRTAKMVTFSEDTSLMIAYLNNMQVTVYLVKMTANTVTNPYD
jgi:hypothetical protein